MKRFITLISLTAVVAGLVGCSGAVTSGYADSTDGKYRCWMRQFGPLNHALIDRWILRIRVVEVIDKTNWLEKPLFTKKYRFKHPNVQIDPSWDSDDNFKMVLYEYGRGVSREAALKTGSRSNLIETVSLTLDRSTGMYHEQR
jgi:hypothetical protein